MNTSPPKKQEERQSWKLLLCGGLITWLISFQNSSFFVDGDYKSRGLKHDLTWSLHSSFLREDVIVLWIKISSVCLFSSTETISSFPENLPCSRIGIVCLLFWQTILVPNQSACFCWCVWYPDPWVTRRADLKTGPLIISFLSPTIFLYSVKFIRPVNCGPGTDDTVLRKENNHWSS